MYFSAKAYLGTMISRKEVVIEQTAGVNEAKICLKLVKKPIPYLQLQNYYNSQHIYLGVFLTSHAYLDGPHDFRTELSTRLGYLLPDNCLMICHALKEISSLSFRKLSKFLLCYIYCVKIKRGDYFAKVIMSLLRCLPQ